MGCFVANQAPRGWRPDDVDPNARKRLRDRERSATMSDEKRMERNKKRRERYMINKVVDKDNSHLAMQLEGTRFFPVSFCNIFVIFMSLYLLCKFKL